MNKQHQGVIQTEYAGIKFRSRLEARWAVFFDALGIRWEYEPEAFEVTYYESGPVRYLPDFWLPGTQTWAEVKGSDEQWRNDAHRMELMLDFGSPLWGVDESEGSTRGLIVLGPIPRSEHLGHVILQHHEGLYAGIARFVKHGITVDSGKSWSSSDPVCIWGYETGEIVADRFKVHRNTPEARDAYARARTYRFWR